MRALRRFLAASSFLAAASSRGEAGQPPPAPPKLGFSLYGGAGLSVKVNRGRTEERLLMVQPQVAYPLGSRFEWLVEGHFAYYFRPDGWAAGLVPVSARYFFGTDRVAPYFGLGAGFGWTNLQIEELNRRFNFILQGSFGIRSRLGDRHAWMVEARWLHYSNAGTVKPNLGHNAVVLLGGWRFR